MARADLLTAFGVMPEEAKAWRSTQDDGSLAPLCHHFACRVGRGRCSLDRGSLPQHRQTVTFRAQQAGTSDGMAWFGTTLLVFVYPMKKRIGRNRRWPRHWFRVHLVAGVKGPLLILFHSGAHLHALVSSLALAAMALVVVSGIAGQGIHYLVLRTLNDRRRLLHDQGLNADEVESHLHRMAAQEEAFRLWQSIHAPMTLMFLALTVLHVLGAIYFGGL